MVCQACYQQGVSGGQFCSGCGAQFPAQAFVPAQPTLFRARQGKVIAGVCAGIAARWGWDPILVRLALVALVLCGIGGGVLAYLAAWIVIPKAPLAYTVPPVQPSAPMQATV
jgi:phage shock protein PspC (stress-responsive transcriptional regulator)